MHSRDLDNYPHHFVEQETDGHSLSDWNAAIGDDALHVHESDSFGHDWAGHSIDNDHTVLPGDMGHPGLFHTEHEVFSGDHSGLFSLFHADIKADSHDGCDKLLYADDLYLTSPNSDSVGLIAARLTELGVPSHAAIEASPVDLLGELLQGRQVWLGTDGNSVAVLDHPLDGFNSQADGKLIFVREINVSDPDGLRLIIANSDDPYGAAISVPFDSFFHEGKGPHYSYVATDKPPMHMEEITHGFDANKGFFENAFKWLAMEAPKFASTVFSVLVGEEVGELLDSDGAKFVSHYATEKIIDSVVGGHKDEHHSESGVGISSMSVDDKLELMKRI